MCIADEVIMCCLLSCITLCVLPVWLCADAHTGLQLSQKACLTQPHHQFCHLCMRDTHTALPMRFVLMRVRPRPSPCLSIVMAQPGLILLVFLSHQQVQTGFGRTDGNGMWAFEAHGVVPDIVTMGKAMGGWPPEGPDIHQSEAEACCLHPCHVLVRVCGSRCLRFATALLLLIVEEHDNLFTVHAVASGLILARLLLYASFTPHHVLPCCAAGNGYPVGGVVMTRSLASAFNTGMEYFNTWVPLDSTGSVRL